ncbi:hypothetical protein MML48_5g00021443 [Holotrichia oblita]|uniref:Uncharacterized protein n=1 Tax=Holotrichia oblita TaxID=644536 RepID=A0ACB9T184_HOLOL|nr:hypothetical protein MML48_5g00021443 [Holotrichia oblita]
MRIFDNFRRAFDFVQILDTYVIDHAEYDNGVRFGLKDFVWLKNIKITPRTKALIPDRSTFTPVFVVETEDDYNDHTLSVDQLKNEILNEDNLKHLGGALSSFMQSDGGKQIGNMIMNGLKNGGSNIIMNQVLQGLGDIMQNQPQQPLSASGPKRSESASQQGLNPELIGNLLNLMLQAKSGDGSGGGGIDLAPILQLLVQFNGQDSSAGVPKTAHFDPMLPKESLTAVVNFFSKKYLGQKVDSKTYIQPIVKYFQELLAIAEQKGIVGTGLDSDELSHKIADTINLEIIEPVVRVNRAYRFALKVPKCDRYVFCLVNQEQPDEVQSIPGFKLTLSRFASVIASWFISDLGHTSFWSLYHVIIEENNCQARYLDECEQFHIEEVKVTTEYVHNEL